MPDVLTTPEDPTAVPPFRRRLRRQQHQKALRPRARPPALRHVHRRQLRAGPAPPRLRSSSTTRSTKRWPATPRTSGVTINNDGSVHGRRRRPRHPRRTARADSPKKGRDVSTLEAVMTNLKCGGKFDKRQLQNLRRPARHRRQGGQFPLRMVRGRSLPRRHDVSAGIRSAAVRRAKLTRSATTTKRGTKITFKPDPQIFTDDQVPLRRRCKSGCRSWRSSISGVRIIFNDDRTGETEEFQYERGLRRVHRASQPRQRSRSTPT